MRKILVSGASGIVGYGILRSLKQSGLDVTLIGTTIYTDSVAQGFCDIFELAPLTSDKAYIPWLIQTIQKHRIDLLIPGIEADMYAWAEHIPALQKAGARVLINKLELIALCKDKWLFCQHLINNNVSCVIESSLDNDFETLKNKYSVPFMLKPRNGFGSKGIVKVEDKSTFEKYCSEIGNKLMVQPFVGSDEEEYTTSAFCDGKGGYMAYMTLRRKLSKDGFTEKAEVVSLVGIENALKELCQLFKPIGPTNFQFRLEHGVLKLLEINPRISSATSIRSAFGYNESKMAVEFFLENKQLTQPVIKKGRAVRYTDDFIFYE